MTRFRSAGPLGPADPYIRRAADDALLAALAAGEYAYVLAPRQSGKSSLVNHVVRELDVPSIRLDMLGLAFEGVAVERVFYSASVALVRSLKLASDPARWVDAHWQRHAHESPAATWVSLLRAAMEAHGGRAVLFVDEVEALAWAKEGMFPLFAAIRTVLHESRAGDEILSRLTVCLLGVYSRLELNRHFESTPYNVGIEIVLEDFTRDQVRGFAPALAADCPEPEELLGAVHDWAGGHPAMTQRLLAAYQDARRDGATVRDVGAWVQQAVEREYLARGQTELTLAYSDQYVVEHANQDRALEALDVYARVVRGETIARDATSAPQQLLALAGLTAIGVEGSVAARNRIYAQVFDEPWARRAQAHLVVGNQAERWRSGGERSELLLSGRGLDGAIAWTLAESDRLRLFGRSSARLYEYLFRSVREQRELEHDAHEKALTQVRQEGEASLTRLRAELERARADAEEQAHRYDEERAGFSAIRHEHTTRLDQVRAALDRSIDEQRRAQLMRRSYAVWAVMMTFAILAAGVFTLQIGRDAKASGQVLGKAWALLGSPTPGTELEALGQLIKANEELERVRTALGDRASPTPSEEVRKLREELTRALAGADEAQAQRRAIEETLTTIVRSARGDAIDTAAIVARLKASERTLQKLRERFRLGVDGDLDAAAAALLGKHATASVTLDELRPILDAPTDADLVSRARSLARSAPAASRCEAERRGFLAALQAELGAPEASEASVRAAAHTARGTADELAFTRALFDVRTSTAFTLREVARRRRAACSCP